MVPSLRSLISYKDNCWLLVVMAVEGMVAIFLSENGFIVSVESIFCWHVVYRRNVAVWCVVYNQLVGYGVFVLILSTGQDRYIL